MKTTINRLLDDEGAVSPVIGVILMVAITVILAAVIGTFVLGLGGQVSETAPQASLTVDAISNGDSSFNISHGGSEEIAFEETNIKVEVGGTSVTFDTESGTGDKFQTADTLEIDLDSAGTGPNQGVFLNGGTTNQYSTTPTSGFSADQDYTITFVDQPSGQVIAEKSGTT